MRWVRISLVWFLGVHAALAEDRAFRLDRSQPIQVQSDRMTVQPKENKALFQGRVEAAQGRLTLAADQMTVFYRGHAAEKENELSKILASGGVTLTLPGRKAKADRGTYDVGKGEILLMGNVTLTDGGNAVYGEEFRYDVATGEGRMTHEAASGGQGGGRARAVLVPKN